jgi:beta-carotene/zeaxanthin 4-ketolase
MEAMKEMRRVEKGEWPLSQSLLRGVGIVGTWSALHVYSVWFLDAVTNPGLAAVLFWTQVWLSAGLFITAHDCMHGSFAPGSTWANKWAGCLCMRLYMGFNFQLFFKKHFMHHKHVGTERDPDYAVEHQDSIPRWYLDFLFSYLDWDMFWTTGTLMIVYSLILWERTPYLFGFYALPSLFSSFQLFFFGTYLPHREIANETFNNAHHSRSSNYPPWLSLLTSFHFGYHEEHHLAPSVPWWGLPVLRHARLSPPQAK